jgi:hypothetical protein
VQRERDERRWAESGRIHDAAAEYCSSDW